MARSVYERFGRSVLAESNSTARQHTVIAGETLPMIAAAEYVDSGYDSELWRQIAEYNGIDDLSALPAGTVLVIPAPKLPSE